MTEQQAKAAVAAHYGLLLRISSPWEVREAKLEVERRRVDIEVVHGAGRSLRCPQCKRECPRHDHAPELRWTPKTGQEGSLNLNPKNDPKHVQ